MLRLFKEHPEFDQYTKFDTITGKLDALHEQVFTGFLPPHHKMGSSGLEKVDFRGGSTFLGETPSTHTRFPRRLYFQITRHCNLECAACFLKAERNGAHVPTRSILEIAEFMGRHGLMEVRLTGGEPTTHPDFMNILHKFQEENVYVSVATNGVIARKTLEAISEVKNVWIICSVDGNKKTHNRYRPDTFDTIIGNLKYLKSRNPDVRIRLTTVLTRENKNQMFELGEIVKYVDAESITVIPLRPQVRNRSMISEMITAVEFRQVIEDLIETKIKLGINFTTTIETSYKKEISADPVFRKKSSCAAGREGTNLDFDRAKNEFLVYGCAYSPACDLTADYAIRKPFLAGSFSPGNIPAFLDIWRDDSRWTVFRDLSFKSEDCRECVFKKRNQCTGSCPIQNLDYSQLNIEEDLLDQLKDQIAHTSEWYCYNKIIGKQSGSDS
ncbi:radical SAM protein [bacterium]|nr:radical SAM protein [bacterium]